LSLVLLLFQGSVTSEAYAVNGCGVREIEEIVLMDTLSLMLRFVHVSDLVTLIVDMRANSSYRACESLNQRELIFVFQVSTIS
jgi:hypothetical protein